jgi:hypothetical protein
MNPPTLFTSALVLGLLAGYLAGGRLRDAVALPWQILAIPWAAIVLQSALPLYPERVFGLDARVFVILLSYVSIVGFLILAWFVTTRTGRARTIRVALALLAFGWALNTTVIAVNGAMPVSREALVAAGHDAADVETAGIQKHELASNDTAVSFLGDMIPVQPIKQVISVGDIAFLLGIAIFIAGSMQLRHASTPSARRATDSVPSPDPSA